MKTNWGMCCLILICLGCLFIGCSTQAKDIDDEERSVFTDPWLNRPTSSKIIYAYDRIYYPEVDFYEVHYGKLKESIAQLEENAAVEISLEHAKFLAGNKDLQIKKNTKPYLVRALYGYRGTGGFSIINLGRNIWVQHSSLGSGRPRLVKQPLIVFFDFSPEIVYVSVSISM